jgi:hypothetical protein
MTKVRTLRPHSVGNTKLAEGHEYDTYAANAERLADAGVVELVEDDAEPTADESESGESAASAPRKTTRRRR